jgi:hypothetical protein
MIYIYTPQRKREPILAHLGIQPLFSIGVLVRTGIFLKAYMHAPSIPAKLGIPPVFNMGAKWVLFLSTLTPN